MQFSGRRERDTKQGFASRRRPHPLTLSLPLSLTTFCIMMILHVIFVKFYACIFSLPAFLSERERKTEDGGCKSKPKSSLLWYEEEARFSTLHANNFMHYGNQARGRRRELGWCEIVLLDGSENRTGVKGNVYAFHENSSCSKHFCVGRELDDALLYAVGC